MPPRSRDSSITHAAEHPIAVRDASLQTVSVTIQTLQVNGKQMTLAVLRQLREEPLIDEQTCELQGTPWGLVNYHSGIGCDEFKSKDHEHLHVVWQKDDELRRSCVRALDYWFKPEPLAYLDYTLQADASAWAGRAILDGWKPQEVFHDPEMGDICWVQFGGRRISIVLSREMQSVLNPWAGYGSLDERRDALSRTVRTHGGKHLTAAEWRDVCEATASTKNAYEARYRTVFDTLRTLDQLFIAI